MIFQTSMIMVHVNLPGCNGIENWAQLSTSRFSTINKLHFGLLHCLSRWCMSFTDGDSSPIWGDVLNIFPSSCNKSHPEFCQLTFTMWVQYLVWWEATKITHAPANLSILKKQKRLKGCAAYYLKNENKTKCAFCGRRCGDVVSNLYLYVYIHIYIHIEFFVYTVYIYKCVYIYP